MFKANDFDYGIFADDYDRGYLTVKWAPSCHNMVLSIL